MTSTVARRMVKPLPHQQWRVCSTNWVIELYICSLKECLQLFCDVIVVMVTFISLYCIVPMSQIRTIMYYNYNKLKLSLLKNLMMMREMDKTNNYYTYGTPVSTSTTMFTILSLSQTMPVSLWLVTPASISHHPARSSPLPHGVPSVYSTIVKFSSSSCQSAVIVTVNTHNVQSYIVQDKCTSLLTDSISCSFVSPILCSAMSNSSVMVQKMTPGSSVLIEKLTPSSANLFTAWSSSMADLVESLDEGHTYIGGTETHTDQLTHSQNEICMLCILANGLAAICHNCIYNQNEHRQKLIIISKMGRGNRWPGCISK